jgi:excisionase family DNA binding protein
MDNEREVKPQLAYTVEEACRQLGCKRTTLYLAISRGELDARKLGSRTIIIGSSLERYLSTRPPANIKLKSGNASGNSPSQAYQAAAKPADTGSAKAAGEAEKSWP